MDWHIITSSKGGIGKTLLTLLLLAYYLENKRDASSLVIDLNGMNTDSAALLLYRKRGGKPVFLKKNTNGEYCLDTVESDTNEFEIYQTYSFSGVEAGKGDQIYYAVGYPSNPYVLHNPQSFANLLTGIKKEASNIQKNLGLTAPFEHIFIDTNYHFCNIFNQNANAHYTTYQAGGSLQEENITVWFLWVYRQLEKLTAERESREAKVVKSTATAMEACLKNNGCQSDGKSTPLKHVFSPAALVTSRAKEGSLTGSLKKLFDAVVGQYDYTVPELKKLAMLQPKENCISFEDWVKKLDIAYNTITDNNKEEHALLFLPILELAGGQQCPVNIIPLPVYQANLRQYTDKDRGDIVKSLRGMKIYQKYFSNLMEK
ncbi:MAG: hypothetical protein BWK78_05580 [Thiotrichaceae bacterium IS1]|nr:MAG: hypothetical protein BWK78_05580 [Thiotrichaceae bacterium IS1]